MCPLGCWRLPLPYVACPEVESLTALLAQVLLYVPSLELATEDGGWQWRPGIVAVGRGQK